MKLPSFQFYPADWRKDPGVQSLSFHDRGVWFEIVCLMHESPQRGKLMLGGQSMPESALARLLGLDKQNLTNTLTTLFEYGVISRCEDTGALANRRMVRDEEIRKIRQECGKLGGNPALLNQNSNQRLNQNPKTLVKQKSTPSSSSSSSTSIKEIPPNPQVGIRDEEIEMIDEEKSPAPHESNALPPRSLPDPSLANDTKGNNPKLVTGHPDAKPANTIPSGWKNMTAIQKKQTRVKTNTPEMIAIGRLMGRRDGNLWSVAEALALEAVSPSSEEIAEMSRYYLADIDRDKDYRRRDLITLLNNWNGELDRARIFKSN